MRTLLLILTTFLAAPLTADIQVFIDDAARPLYEHRGSSYVEALRGREFSLRITNPHPYRVAVALSVDGLNTIDAKHGDAWSAAKWVLEPYQSTDIEGWQVSDREARRFFFTGERDSYAARLGRTDDLGVIEAVFYRERPRPVARYESAAAQSKAAPAPASAGALSDEYAATGMGDRTRHDVERVNIDLDPAPVSSQRIRYEFRPQLVRLGVIAEERPLVRREKARGFEPYCPES